MVFQKQNKQLTTHHTTLPHHTATPKPHHHGVAVENVILEHHNYHQLHIIRLHWLCLIVSRILAVSSVVGCCAVLVALFHVVRFLLLCHHNNVLQRSPPQHILLYRSGATMMITKYNFPLSFLLRLHHNTTAEPHKNHKNNTQEPPACCPVPFLFSLLRRDIIRQVCCCVALLRCFALCAVVCFRGGRRAEPLTPHWGPGAVEETMLHCVINAIIHSTDRHATLGCALFFWGHCGMMCRHYYGASVVVAQQQSADAYARVHHHRFVVQ